MGHAFLGQLQLHRLDRFTAEFHDALLLPGQRGRLQARQEGFDSYVLGLLLPGARKSMQPIARRTLQSEDKIQHFITDAPWNFGRVQHRIIEVMRNVASSPDAVIVLDGTDQPKQGDNTVGVQWQYSGHLGKEANTQASVAAVYAIPDPKYNPDIVAWPFASELYLPPGWLTPEKREEGGIPGRVEFRTKPTIALDFVDRLRNHDVPHQAVVADADFGSDGAFREALRLRAEKYVLGVNPGHFRTLPVDVPIRNSQRGFLVYDAEDEVRSAKDWASELPKEAWTEVTWARGSKGPLRGVFARVRVRVVRSSQRRATTETGWLLLEQRTRQLKAYMCWGFDDASLEDLVRVAHARWVVEQSFQVMKTELGLDHFEGRTYDGIHHHVTVVMVAYCYLAWLRIEHPEIRQRSLTSGKRSTLQQVREAWTELWLLQHYLSKGYTEREARKRVEEIPAALRSP